MKKILIMAGGTGGHIFPALTIADALQQRGVAVHWLGSQVGMEQEIVGTRYPMSMVAIRGVRGKSIFSKLLAPWQILSATHQAYKVIRQQNPDIVLGMGGFTAGPGGVASWLARKPLVIHEQNAIAGYTNKILARFARKVFQAFPRAFPASLHPITVGNPVRALIRQLPAPAQRLTHTGALRVLILGGSRGASAINQVMLAVAQQFPQAEQLNFWHQVGKADFEKVQSRYAELSVAARVQPFIENMAEAYAWADVVVCRAGAMTVAEVAAAGVASIFVPFPYAVDDHQRFNALHLVEQGAAQMILQQDLTAEKMIALLQDFLLNRAQLLKMAEKARECAVLDTVERMVKECEMLAQRQ